MPVLPLVELPVSSVATAGPLLLRVDFRGRLTTLYLRRESDKQNWVCTVRTLQEILAPTQLARPLDVEAVVTCLYHRFAVDTSDPHAPLELTRVEVAFAQPDTWIDTDQLHYRLTMRIAVRTTAVATVLADAAPTGTTPGGDVVVEGNQADAFTAIAVPTDVADETIVFGFNFEPTKDDIERHTPKIYGSAVRRCATLRLFGAGFPHEFLNWSPAPNQLAVVEKNRIAFLLKATTPLEITLTAVHPRGAVLVVVSLDDRVVQPTNTVSFHPSSSSHGGDLAHTVIKFAASVAPTSHIQVAVLPGSACLVEGTSLSIREVNLY